jgi:hypothetical protein
MSLNFNNLLQKEYLFGYFNRNKKIFTVSILIFLLFALMGSFFFTIEDINNEIIQKRKKTWYVKKEPIMKAKMP